MSWMDNRRQAFNPDGPFLAKRAGNAGAIELEWGKTYTREQLNKAGVDDRVIERMYGAYWFDMAAKSGKAAPFTRKATDDGPAAPLDRDGDGGLGGSLTDEEEAALAKAGYTVEQWLQLGEAARDEVMAEALLAAGGPETGPEAAETPTEGETPPEAPQAAPAASGVATGYKHFGFGKWYALDADGNKTGKAVSKTTAAGYAARDNVPLIGAGK